MSSFKIIVETFSDDVTYYKAIKPLLFNEEENDMNIDESIYYIHSSQLYSFIVGALSEGKIVKIPKKLKEPLKISDIITSTIISKSSILSPQESFNDSSLSIESLKIKYINMITIEHIKKIQNDPILILKNYEFIKLNNYFATMGIFITDENRDEKYLELINMISNSEDEQKNDEIITNLEKYLDLFNELNNISNIYNIYYEFKNEIMGVSIQDPKLFREIYNRWSVKMNCLDNIIIE